jgi:putative peptidoglycan lipid II flippase
MAVGLMVIADPVVRLVYKRGAFDETAVYLTSQAFFFYAIGFPAQALAKILNRTFFSLKETWIPSKLSLFRIGLKMVLSLILIRRLGHVSIAIADSVSNIIRVIFLFAMLPKELKRQEIRHSVKSFGETLAASILMGGVVYVVGTEFEHVFSLPFELFGLAFLGVGAYALMAVVTKREEFKMLLGSLRTLVSRYLPMKS